MLQEAAWSSTLTILQDWFEDYVGERPEVASWHIVFEFQMPRARDRPLDACLLSSDDVIVLEVKDTRSASLAAVDQLRGYIRDLQEYHAGSRQRTVEGMVLLTGASTRRQVGGISVGNVDALRPLLDRCRSGGLPAEEVQAWLQAPYEPLPSIVEAALMVFEEQPLPQIRTVEGAEIEETVEQVLDAAEQARRASENHLILLTGVPGSGKTLVGLQSVYDFTRDPEVADRGVFLSGNGPLIEVLQYQLETSVLVQDIHKFVPEYAPSEGIPEEHLYVFDEAQRAWDRDYVQIVNQKKKRDLPPQSEPEMLLRILGRREKGACLVAIIGEGQSIWKGEQSGFRLWSDAVDAVEAPWEIHTSPRVSFREDGPSTQVNPQLHLSHTVRAHKATMLADWIEAVLDKRPDEALNLSRDLVGAGFWLRLTRDLDAAKAHVRETYQGQPERTFGMVGSSKANNLGEYGVDLSYVGAHWLRPGQVGPWYVDKPDQAAKCRELVQAAQEFQCQGLELDGTVVLWGRDLSLQDADWVTRTKRVPGIRDPHILRLNAYRILLSRARDGMVIFVTPEEEMDETADHLSACGVELLP